jgi:adenosine deaminase
VIDNELRGFIGRIPKAEPHIHCDSVYPELLLRIAERNGVSLPFASVEGANSWYSFEDLGEFLQKWATTTAVLQTEPDYYEVAYEMGRDMTRQNILRREAMFDYTAGHEGRVELDVMLSGLARGRLAVKDEFDADLFFIANIDRTISPDRSLEFVERIIGYKDEVGLVGLGLESQEVGYPAGSHAPAFRLARENGLRLSAHCGEEYAAGPAGVWEVLESLEPDRIDHGNQAIRDDALVAHLAETQIPLNLCPMSNVGIKVYEDVSEHPVIALRDRGVLVTVSSDDPPFMKHDLVENYVAIAEAFDLGRDDIAALARNSFIASYCGDDERSNYLSKLDHWLTDAAS